jgi:hypothetical protein
MMIQSHFEISVAVEGRHLFTTSDNSFSDMTDAGERRVQQAARALQRGLAKDFDNVQVTISRVECRGRMVAVAGGR